jgi:glycosyltransferase involved in cell wall biosynthesis
LRIAIDARSLEESSRTGVARYLSSILREMALLEPQNHYLLLFQNRVVEDAVLSQACFEKQLVKVPLPPRKKVPWEQVWLPRHLRSLKADLLFSPSYSTPVLSPVKTVVTIHDITYEVNPKWFHPKERLKMRILTRIAASRANHIIAVSEATKKDLVNHYGVNPEKISVIHEASGDEFVSLSVDEKRIREKYQLKGEFFLFVGSFFSRRNLPVLVEAFQNVAKGNSNAELLLIGQDRSYPPLGLDKLLAKKSLGERVKWVEYVPEADLVSLYNLAAAFVYPSSYEGFGLPVLEAMSCGTPVITGAASSLPEVVGDAGILVDPTDSKELALAMLQVLENISLRQELIKRGLERAKLFSWRRAAQETLEVFRKVIRN